MDLTLHQIEMGAARNSCCVCKPEAAHGVQNVGNGTRNAFLGKPRDAYMDLTVDQIEMGMSRNSCGVCEPDGPELQ